MSTEIYQPRHETTPPLLQHLSIWLTARRRSRRVEARPVQTTASTGVLDKGCTLWVEQPMAREVRCTQGTLWLTFDGVRKDVVLEAGRSYRCDCGSRLAIHALQAAGFELD